MLTSYILYPKNSILDKIFISCYIITILYLFTSASSSIISTFGNHLHIVLKTISSGINISKRGLFDKTPCFLWQKQHDIVLKTTSHWSGRGGMFTFFNILSIPVNTLGVQLTPHVQNLKSLFSSPLPTPFHSTPHKKIAKIHKMSSRTSSRKSL